MDIQTILDRPVEPWLSGEFPESDIVLSSRIRLARNLRNELFPVRSSEADLAKTEQMIRGCVKNLQDELQDSFAYIQMESLTPENRLGMVEKHLISPNLANQPLHRGILLNQDANVVIMVNEEDHLRIQCMEGGLQLQKAWQVANTTDDAIESKLDFAFDNRWGYLTACPTNVGTGLRASVMMHVPALVRTNKIKRLIQSILRLGFAVRGIYGEGSDILGNILQISNKTTLGSTEEEFIEGLEKLCRQVVAEERKARELLRQNEEGLEDEVWRSYGILRYAKSITSQEALQLLSTLELGRQMGMLDTVSADFFRRMMVLIQPGFLQHYLHRPDLANKERDRWRATLIKDQLMKE